MSCHGMAWHGIASHGIELVLNWYLIGIELVLNWYWIGIALVSHDIELILICYWFGMVWYGIALYCMVWYCIVWYCMVLYSIVHVTARHGTARHGMSYHTNICCAYYRLYGDLTIITPTMISNNLDFHPLASYCSTNNQGFFWKYSLCYYSQSPHTPGLR